MGGMWFQRNELASTLSELVGYKAGIALNDEQLIEHLGDQGEVLNGEPEAPVRIRGEEFDEAVATLLYAVGSTPVRHPVMPAIDLFHRHKHETDGQERVTKFLEIAVEELNAPRGEDEPVNYTPVFVRAEAEMGIDGTLLAQEFYEMIQLSIHQNAWSSFRRHDWKDVAQLEDLFKSESLESFHGHFIDQRFIDYLERNFGAIDAMNWRKFEALTGEFFDRAGFHVEMGEGRNDGGIDVRIWPDRQSRSNPPAVLIQCKRQKEKVGKVVVKALWADVVAEQAASGLIVTTSSLSPGADKVRKVRMYPVEQANRATLKKWVEAMRTPNSGVFM